MSFRLPRLAAWVLWGLLGTTPFVGVLGPAVPAAAQAPMRIFVTIDKSQLVSLPDEPFTKVAVANPNIADVQVITPTQLLVNGKTGGVTSLLVFYPKRVQHFDLVVQAGPMLPTSAPDAGADRHAVLVQRGDKITESMFVRDKDDVWVELGAVRTEPEAAKK